MTPLLFQVVQILASEAYRVMVLAEARVASVLSQSCVAGFIASWGMDVQGTPRLCELQDVGSKVLYRCAARGSIIMDSTGLHSCPYQIITDSTGLHSCP